MGTKISALTALTTPADADVLAIVDDDASATKKITWLNLKNSLTNLGKTQRAQFSFKDADEIYADAGFYDCDGKIAWWGAQLTLTLAGAGADTWYYVYLDYSAITSNTELTNSEIIFSDTAPTWNAAKMGWYNGSDRAVFAVLTDGSNNILEFYHDGDFVTFANRLTGGQTSKTDYDYSAIDLDTTWDDVYLPIPGFAKSAEAILYSVGTTNATSNVLSWRTNGQTGATGHRVMNTYSTNNAVNYHYNTLRVFTDATQIIEIKHSVSGTQTASVWVTGWYFPVGM